MKQKEQICECGHDKLSHTWFITRPKCTIKDCSGKKFKPQNHSPHVLTSLKGKPDTSGDTNHSQDASTRKDEEKNSEKNFFSNTLPDTSDDDILRKMKKDNWLIGKHGFTEYGEQIDNTLILKESIKLTRQQEKAKQDEKVKLLKEELPERVFNQPILTNDTKSILVWEKIDKIFGDKLI